MERYQGNPSAHTVTMAGSGNRARRSPFFAQQGLPNLHEAGQHEQGCDDHPVVQVPEQQEQNGACRDAGHRPAPDSSH